MHTLLFLYFAILSVFFKFSTSTQNVAFQIYQSYMEIGLYEVIKYYMSQGRMINLFQIVLTNFSLKNVSNG